MAYIGLLLKFLISSNYFICTDQFSFLFQKTEPWEVDENEQENENEEEEEEEEPRKRRKRKKHLRLIGDELYRVNQSGKAFKLNVKVKT